MAMIGSFFKRLCGAILIAGFAGAPSAWSAEAINDCGQFRADHA